MKENARINQTVLKINETGFIYVPIVLDYLCGCAS